MIEQNIQNTNDTSVKFDLSPDLFSIIHSSLTSSFQAEHDLILLFSSSVCSRAGGQDC